MTNFDFLLKDKQFNTFSGVAVVAKFYIWAWIPALSIGDTL